MAGPLGFEFPNYNLRLLGDALAFLIEILVMAVFVHLAAHAVVKKSAWTTAFVAGTLGLVLAQIAMDLVPSQYWIVGLLLGLVAFAGVAAAVYRGKFRDGAAIGAVSWVLWILANIGLSYVQQHWK